MEENVIKVLDCLNKKDVKGKKSKDRGAKSKANEAEKALRKAEERSQTNLDLQGLVDSSTPMQVKESNRYNDSSMRRTQIKNQNREAFN